MAMSRLLRAWIHLVLGVGVAAVAEVGVVEGRDVEEAVLATVPMNPHRARCLIGSGTVITDGLSMNVGEVLRRHAQVYVVMWQWEFRIWKDDVGK